MAGSPPNFHKMDSRSACIQGVLKVKVKVKVKGHVIRALFWILGMSHSRTPSLTVWLFSYLQFLQIPNRLGENVRKPRGGGCLTLYSVSLRNVFVMLCPIHTADATKLSSCVAPAV